MGRIRISLRIGRPLVLVIVLAVVAASVAPGLTIGCQGDRDLQLHLILGSEDRFAQRTWHNAGEGHVVVQGWRCHHWRPDHLPGRGRERSLARRNRSGGETGVFIYLIDGGSPGTEDLAVTWVQDPDQSFDELQGWCESQFTDVPLFELDRGNLTVRAGR